MALLSILMAFLEILEESTETQPMSYQFFSGILLFEILSGLLQPQRDDQYARMKNY